jgi:hypothetical protein
MNWMLKIVAFFAINQRFICKPKFQSMMTYTREFSQPERHLTMNKQQWLLRLFTINILVLLLL